MKLKSGLLAIFVSALFLFVGLAHAAEAEFYRLLAGDRVAISVWGEETLNIKDLIVLPDGTVTFPLVGSVVVAGLTSNEASVAISEKLKSFLPEPQVTLVVNGVSGNLAYVIGKVAKPGPVGLQSPLTAIQALSAAGPLDKFADTKQIKVIRKKADGSQVALDLNYDDLMRGHRLESNIVLQAGDTIVIP